MTRILTITHSARSRIHGASSGMVIDELERAAGEVVPATVEWVDAVDHQLPDGGHAWSSYGHAYIGGEPTDIYAEYTIDAAGGIVRACVTVSTAVLS